MNLKKLWRNMSDLKDMYKNKKCFRKSENYLEKILMID